jgi:hypothetical protein
VREEVISKCNFLKKDFHAVGNVKNGRFVTDRISERSENALHSFVPVIEKYFDTG